MDDHYHDTAPEGDDRTDGATDGAASDRPARGAANRRSGRRGGSVTRGRARGAYTSQERGASTGPTAPPPPAAPPPAEAPAPAPGPARGLPTGFRSSRRSTRAGKAHRRDLAWFRMRVKAMGVGQQALFIGAAILGGLAVGVLVLWGAATVINAASRWYLSSQAGSAIAARRREAARDNVLIIGVKDGKAIGFIAARVELQTRRIFGIAIPDGAFVEVPGQGFERIGDSYASGADVSKAAVSNYLSVPFDRYVAIPYDQYQAALKNQSLAGLTGQVLATDIDASDLKVLGATVDSIPSKDVAIVPLPVRPITIGDQRFFQPQRQQVADLLQSWWGVKVGPDDRVRVIVENGSGSPGIAGAAARALIGAGYQVVDTKNAPAFGRKDTLIILYRGQVSTAQRIKDTLKTGTITKAVSDQDLADVIVIIGKDYKPAAK